MNRNSQLKPEAAFSSPVDAHQDSEMASPPVQFGELWVVLRGILLVWAVAVWLLLVMMPGMEQVSNFATAVLHVPSMFIGLGLVAAMFAAYNLRSDGHLLWFLGVLLLLAGWM